MIGRILKKIGLLNPRIWYRLNPDKPHPYLSDGLICLKEGKNQEGEKLLTRVSASSSYVGPDRIRATHSLVDHFLARELPDDAAQALNLFYSDLFSGYLPGSYYSLKKAQISDLKGEERQALEHFEAAVKAACWENKSLQYQAYYEMISFCLGKCGSLSTTQISREDWLTTAAEAHSNMQSDLSDTDVFVRQEACIWHLGVAIDFLRDDSDAVCRRKSDFERLAKVFGGEYEPVKKGLQLITICEASLAADRLTEPLSQESEDD